MRLVRLEQLNPQLHGVEPLAKSPRDVITHQAANMRLG
jgi:hypothetical protein